MGEVKTLLERVSSYLPQDKVDLVEQTYEYASDCHLGQSRQSGEPYIAHPRETALFLSDLHVDANTIMAALLHDVMEDCGVTFEDIESRFGTEVAGLVDSVTKLTKLDARFAQSAGAGSSPAEDQDRLDAESLRKMLVAMAEDVRVVLIKLADRLHNMNTLDALPPEKRRRISQETLDIYSPLAHRLGIWDIKWRLDDRAFRHLNPGKYQEISDMLAAKRTEREAYVERVSSHLGDALEGVGVAAEVVGRPKAIYSIFRKIKKYETQGKELGDIHDLYALRVQVKTNDDCYKALGVVHQLWHPVTGQFDDYIANPKENGYQSLHTSVICEGGTPLEVQIKTHDMHQIAEYGVAAHWRYKEGKHGDSRFEEKMAWMRQLLDWQRDVAGTAEFIETVKEDIFKDQVLVFTPKGRIVELSAGSTPVDFAYKIHTELGHRCIGAKVNGRLVPLDTALKSGDTVEILAAKAERAPSLDWLNPNLGYVRSAGARERIRQWFHRQARSANIHRGRELLRKELRRLNRHLNDAEILALVKFDKMADFLANLGSGGITEAQVAHRLVQVRQEPEPLVNPARPALPLSSPSSGISVLGVGDLLIRMAPCCNPIPGDDILGFVTRSRGVTVHKKDCASLQNEDEPDRIIDVDWGEAKELYPVRVRLEAYDRVGLLRDITVQVSEERVNIASVVTEEHPDGTVSISLTLHTTGIDQLGKLFTKLERVRSVTSATRVEAGATATGLTLIPTHP